MSISSPRERRMMSIASSITSRLRRPRKSIFSRPISSIGPIEYWVTILYWRSALPAAVGVAAAARLVLGQLQRHHLLQRPVGDHHRGGVDRVVADDPLEALGDVDDPLRVGLGVVGLFQLLARLEAFREGGAAAHDRLRDLLREAVAGAVVEAEHAGGVAGRGARRHLAEGDDLGDRLAAVLLGDVADHPLAAADREVDVDIRHRLAAGVEEALEEQVFGERVEVGDREDVGDDRARRRATARADGDAVLLRVADEVPDDQEVGRRSPSPRSPRARTRSARPPRPAAGRRSGRAGPRRRSGAASPPAPRRPRSGSAAAAACRARCRASSARRSRARSAPPPATRRRTRHFLGVLDVELVGVEAHLRRFQGRLRLHAEQRRVVVEVLAPQVVDVGGADQRPAQLAGEADDPLVGLVLLGDAVLLHLEVDLLGAEGLDQVVEVGAGVVGALLDQAPAEARLQAAGEDDDALGVARRAAPCRRWPCRARSPRGSRPR